MKKFLIAAIMSIFIAGCASFQTSNQELAITYATLKVIDRDNGIEAEDILSTIDRVDAVVFDRSIPVTKLREEVLHIIGFHNLGYADQFLIHVLLDDIEQSIKRDSDSEEVRVMLVPLLDTIRRAAALSSE